MGRGSNPRVGGMILRTSPSTSKQSASSLFSHSLTGQQYRATRHSYMAAAIADW
jgi:hypothetical protein